MMLYFLVAGASSLSGIAIAGLRGTIVAVALVCLLLVATIGSVAAINNMDLSELLEVEALAVVTLQAGYLLGGLITAFGRARNNSHIKHSRSKILLTKRLEKYHE